MDPVALFVPLSLRPEKLKRPKSCQMRQACVYDCEYSVYRLLPVGVLGAVGASGACRSIHLSSTRRPLTKNFVGRHREQIFRVRVSLIIITEQTMSRTVPRNCATRSDPFRLKVRQGRTNDIGTHTKPNLEGEKRSRGSDEPFRSLGDS